jgi:hypothetical protein
MIAAYHGKADGCTAEILAVNPFAPAAQTAARLRGCDRSARPRKRCRHALYASITEDEESLSRAEPKWPCSLRSRRRDGGRGEDVSWAVGRHLTNHAWNDL